MKKYFILLVFLVAGAMFFATKAGQKMENNRIVRITEDTENKLDSILANLALCEMSLEENDLQSAMRYTLRAKHYIIEVKNKIQNEPNN